MSTFGQVYASTFSGLMDYLLATYNNGANTQNVESTNAANVAMNSATNLTNYKIAQETNAANAEQAELAYKRSLPMNQMYDMMQAGLSKSAAASKIAGGGQYSPATMVGANMNAGHVEAPRFDPSLIHDAIRSFADMPQNVMQEQLQREQLENVKQQRELALNEDRRKQQEHDLAIDEKLYTKWERESMDSFMSLMEERAQQKNIQPKPNQSMHDYVRELGLQDDPSYKKLPASARSRAFDHYKQAQQEKRDQMENERRNNAAADAHALLLLEQQLKNVDVRYYNKEKHEQLLNLMRTGQGLIQENNIKFQEYTAKEMENFVREAGINNEREARALAEYVKKLANDDELDVAEKGYNYPRFMKQGRAGWRLFLRDFGEILSKVKFGG